jgi:ectoine hydroxylase-related dioxygenase (phytanoyl-CoA dioxygenase family)
MRNIFLDKKLQSEFDKKGYVILDILTPEQIAAFISLYDEVEGAKGTANTNKNTYELSFFDKNADAKKRKFNTVYGFMKPFIDKHLDSYSPIIVNLFNKEHGTGEVPVHQNWTFVDEKKYSSVTIWCPLQKVSRENGTLEVVPGTHKVISDFRGPSIPWVFDNLNEVMKDKYMLPLELNPGQVAVIDDSVIHYSGINNTYENRRAVQFIMKPAEAPTIHCYKEDKENDTISIMDVDDNYFFDFDMWAKPKAGTNLRTEHFPIHKISEDELVQLSSRNLIAEY